MNGWSDVNTDTGGVVQEMVDCFFFVFKYISGLMSAELGPYDEILWEMAQL